MSNIIRKSFHAFLIIIHMHSPIVHHILFRFARLLRQTSYSCRKKCHISTYFELLRRMLEFLITSFIRQQRPDRRSKFKSGPAPLLAPMRDCEAVFLSASCASCGADLLQTNPAIRHGCRIRAVASQCFKTIPK